MPQGGQTAGSRAGTRSKQPRKDATTESRKKLAPKIRRTAKPAEKQVRQTDKTVAVAPVKQGTAARKPLKVAAIDHRRQMVGTDEPKGESTRASRNSKPSAPRAARR